MGPISASCVNENDSISICSSGNKIYFLELKTCYIFLDQLRSKASVVNTGRGWGGGVGGLQAESLTYFCILSPFHDVFCCRTNTKSVFQLKEGLPRDNAFSVYRISVTSPHSGNYG